MLWVPLPPEKSTTLIFDLAGTFEAPEGEASDAPADLMASTGGDWTAGVMFGDAVQEAVRETASVCPML